MQLLYIIKYHKRAVPVLFILLLFAAAVLSCTEKRKPRTAERAFYYWKSVLTLSDFELQQLDALHINTLYIRFFDADWNSATQQPVPVAKLQPAGFKLPQQFSIIPTIFITNECLKKMDAAQVKPLADNIYKLVQDMIRTYGFASVKEIQIDCDWTASTKNNYFLLLENISSLWKSSGIPVSATIRLHQVKYRSKTGVPPVKRGLLMCYNMGNLKNPATDNSIIETAELEKYTASLSGYPLPLDIALPLFEWKVLFRNNVYSGLIESLPDSTLTASVTAANGNRFTFLKDTVLAGYTFKKGDVLRNEQSSYKEIMRTAQSVSRQLKNTSLRVSLYHLDSLLLKKYSLHELETVFNCLR